MAKTYTELSTIVGYEERFKYLALNGVVGESTFGSERYLNQAFYRGSREWLKARDLAMLRDSFNGYVCDLGDPDHPIFGFVVVHHIEPITIEAIEEQSSKLFDLDNLICTADLTHKALHFGNFEILPKDYVPREPNDTCPWKM